MFRLRAMKIVFLLDVINISRVFSKLKEIQRGFIG